MTWFTLFIASEPRPTANVVQGGTGISRLPIRTKTMHDAKQQIEPAELDDALLDAHMRQRVGTFAINGLALVIAYFLLRSSLDVQLLNVWLFVGAAIVAARALFSAFIGRGKRAKGYLKIHYALVGLSGVVWGALSLFWSADSTLSIQLIIILFPLALAVGSVSANGSWLPTFYCFAVPAQLPTILVLLTSGNSGMIKIAIPAFVFLMVQILLAKAYNSQLRETLRLRLLNERMADNLVKRNADLSLANEQAKAAKLSKSEFLARMSHEIRTPINGVLGMAEMLRNTKLNLDQTSAVESLCGSGKELLHLINELLDVSTLESGSYELNQADFNVHRLLADINKQQQANIQSDKLELMLRIDAEVPAMMHGDEHRLEQILSNLVGNAIKFSEQGVVELSVVSTSSAGKASLRFCVTDNGIGIAAKSQQSIFEVFQQGDGSITRQFGGSGLGLSIAKSFTELMDGTISVESNIGRGSKFIVDIPLTAALMKQSEEPGDDKMQSEQTLASLPANVLVAEDNPINQAVITAMLESFDCEVTIVDNGEEVLHALAESEYDIVFMDCQMPVMDGLSATQIARERGEKTPIVAVTANAMKGDREICLAAGMNDYVSKPLEADKLHFMLVQWVFGGERPVSAA